MQMDIYWCIKYVDKIRSEIIDSVLRETAYQVSMLEGSSALCGSNITARVGIKYICNLLWDQKLSYLKYLINIVSSF